MMLSSLQPEQISFFSGVMLTCQQEQMSISVYKTNVCLVSLLLPFHYSAWKWVSPDQISHLFGRLVSELRDTDS